MWPTIVRKKSVETDTEMKDDVFVNKNIKTNFLNMLKLDILNMLKGKKTVKRRKKLKRNKQNFWVKNQYWNKNLTGWNYKWIEFCRGDDSWTWRHSSRNKPKWRDQRTIKTNSKLIEP